MAEGRYVLAILSGLSGMACASTMPVSASPPKATDRDLMDADRALSEAKPVRPAGFPRVPFPASVAGLTFGVPIGDFKSWCAAHAGGVVELPQVTACYGVRLPGFPIRIDTAIPSFCDGRLCRLSLNTTRPPPTEAEMSAAVLDLERLFGPGLVSSEDLPCPGYAPGRYWLWGDPKTLWSISVDSSCGKSEEHPILSVIYSTPESQARPPENRPYI